MKTRLLTANGQKTFVLILDKGDEVVSALSSFARHHEISAAHLTAIGAFSEVTLGYFDREQKDYLEIPLREQVEVLSLVGDVALARGEPQLHAHVVVGKRDGTAHGGHLMRALVWPTLEVILVESPAHLRGVRDAETGLALIDAGTPTPASAW
jgi:predicted DNA-binding protein with PD1-like motif